MIDSAVLSFDWPSFAGMGVLLASALSVPKMGPVDSTIASKHELPRAIRMHANTRRKEVRLSTSFSINGLSHKFRKSLRIQ